MPNSQIHSTRTYKYDGLGRRVAKQSELNGQIQQKRFLWQGFGYCVRKAPAKAVCRSTRLADMRHWPERISVEVRQRVSSTTSTPTRSARRLR